MTATHISIKESSELSGKSVQTIRRMIKAKKVKFRKEKTPQGFNYLIDKDSLCEYFGIKIEKEEPITENVTTEEVEAVEVHTINTPAESQEENKDIITNDRAHQKIVNYEPVREFNDTMQKLIEQHGKEKENLFKLIESFQNKVIDLETKVKNSKQRKSWLKLW
jgi:hypothetical protein